MAFQAYSKHGNRTAETPQDAAEAHFRAFPKARKCNVIEGKAEGGFFTVTYGRKSTGEWPASWKDVTRATVASLPCEVQS